jgi:hypothetical protein
MLQLYKFAVQSCPLGFDKLEFGVHAEQGFRMADEKEGF